MSSKRPFWPFLVFGTFKCQCCPFRLTSWTTWPKSKVLKLFRTCIGIVQSLCVVFSNFWQKFLNFLLIIFVGSISYEKGHFFRYVEEILRPSVTFWVDVCWGWNWGQLLLCRRRPCSYGLFAYYTYMYGKLYLTCLLITFPHSGSMCVCYRIVCLKLLNVEFIFPITYPSTFT